MAFVTAGPTIRFSQLCWQKMWALVHACDIEISWIGIIATDEEREAAGVEENFYFTDIYVVEQECDATNTDMKDGAICELTNRLMNEGIDPGRCKMWGHSHPTFSTKHSAKDEETVERLQLEPLISIILNKMGEVTLRCDVWEPWRHSYECDYVIDEVQLIPDGWGKEMVDKYVTKKKVFPVTYKKPATGFSKGKSYGYYGADNTSWDANWYVGSSSKKSKETEVEDDYWGMLDIFSFPKELELLKESFEDKIIDINELLEYYSKWYAQEMSAEEIDDELLSMASGTKVKLVDDNDDAPPFEDDDDEVIYYDADSIVPVVEDSSSVNGVHSSTIVEA